MMNAWLGEVTNKIKSALEPSEGTPPGHKRGVGSDNANGQASQDRKRMVSPHQMPFSKNQRDWLEKTLQNSSTLIVTACHERFGELEKRIEIVESGSGQVDRRMAAQQLKIEEQNKLIEDQRTEMNKLKDDTAGIVASIAELRAAQAQAATQNPAQQPPNPVAAEVPDTPYEQRTTAVIGRLGWDLSGAECKDKSEAILREIGVPYTAVIAFRSQACFGCTVEFDSADLLRKARIKVQALNRTLPGARGPVWLDAQKTRAERRPTMMLTRAERWTRETLDEKDGVWEVLKDTRKRMLTLDAAPMGAPAGRQWKWLNAATNVLSDEERAIGKDYIETL